MSQKKILIVSDAWLPQINGVVRTLEETAHELRRLKYNVEIYGPNTTLWNTFSVPSYASIKLELFGQRRLLNAIQNFRPDYIHIATEGPLGWAARTICLKQKLPFTTSYHTRFPEYLAARVPRFLAKPLYILATTILRRFHAPSSAILVATSSIEQDLHQHKFRRLARWSRGVDTTVFRPYGKNISAYAQLPRPILLYVGRVAIEKNVRAFLDLTTDGSKVIIGDGPDLDILQKSYPEAHFLGVFEGEELARHYAAADLFVFPSTTDTFGLVLLEACACGLRIASYPAPGPADIFGRPGGSEFTKLNPILQQAVDQALTQPDTIELPRQFAKNFSWETCTKQFLEHLQAPTPQALKRLTRLRHWLSRWWQHALALALK